jgi:hypothetical protein
MSQPAGGRTLARRRVPVAPLGNTRVMARVLVPFRVRRSRDHTTILHHLGDRLAFREATKEAPVGRRHNHSELS